MNIEKKKTSPAQFVRQVRQELQKVIWPQRRDTFISSAIVILLIFLFSIFFLLTDQATKLGISEHIEEISVPTQNIVEVKRGVRINSERKIFPGYILIKMNLNDDTWHIIKNTPKLSGFLGNKGKPIPISNAEAKRISEQVIDGVEKSRPAVMYDVGEQVKVIDGPFASFNGEIEQIDEEKARLRVAVSIFGRLTPVDLEYSQVEKV